MKLDLALTDVIVIGLSLRAAAQKEAELGHEADQLALLRLAAEVERQRFSQTSF